MPTDLDRIVGAAHVPPGVLRPTSKFPWSIEVHDLTRRPWSFYREKCGFDTWTCLRRHTDATVHLGGGVVVMEDSNKELRTHSEIFLRGRGRVLVTGLGLGCVVRGLLAKPEVDHVDVVELDPWIIQTVGPEFVGNPRVALHEGDALVIDLPGEWDFAWHDLWTEKGTLQIMHMNLFMKFWDRAGWQGAWAFPKDLERQMNRRTRRAG